MSFLQVIFALETHRDKIEDPGRIRGITEVLDEAQLPQNGRTDNTKDTAIRLRTQTAFVGSRRSWMKPNARNTGAQTARNTSR